LGLSRLNVVKWSVMATEIIRSRTLHNTDVRATGL
jgi:hypothetical protein